MVDPGQLIVRSLGESRIPSPLGSLLTRRGTTEHYVDEADRVLLDDTVAMLAARGDELPSFEPGGPRRRIYFDPSKIRAGIVTCGGLCPGLNDVIRGLVLTLNNQYGVSRILGFRNGYQGLTPGAGHSVVELTPAGVEYINEHGGTILGTSRGNQDPEEIVDCLEQLGVNLLFVVGGDGSMRGARLISETIAARDRRIAVVGVPKTIDNDIPYIGQSFGFQTAYAKAAESIRAAHVEAAAQPSGVGLVQLMGRHSGFIASYAALANNDADYVLIPEVPFSLDGFLPALRRRVADRGHALVVVAEGAGQEHLRDAPLRLDASGNRKLGDFGLHLRDRILDDFAAAAREVNLKYIDPSYAIRSVPANPYDSVYCLRLAQAAVHAAMAGRTELVVGMWRGRFVHVPIPLAVSGRNQVDPDGDLWLSVLEATGQPPDFTA
ncbi:ATP-dependent 6-phosphofructokinase [Actinoplanes friuliensis]|jgi:6-phosphofructokinase 1|uniref:ATP-dependent 6-phosphofructokinase n=1 Tax=Actinoplanes friuliensis DSM 7358 TaxID=1246995 RepID=U5W531_9ACTN|nr:ATP-dependent 6-phosphofructokinase [Actinoplanes friuliensis]AGZ44328.1 diphosphate--fructose-6-phosphate 1-phosphotransferase [Actinoplanes friuliensis DSM 7358]